MKQCFEHKDFWHHKHLMIATFLQPGISQCGWEPPKPNATGLSKFSGFLSI